MSKSLKVIYDGPIDSIFDKDVETFLKSHGWKWWASGINLIDNKRDLAFDKMEGTE